VHYKNRLIGKGARRGLFAAYEHTVAPVLVRAADRVCVLSADHAGSVPYLRRTGERHPGKLIEMPNGVDTEMFAPGSTDGGRKRGSSPGRRRPLRPLPHRNGRATQVRAAVELAAVARPHGRGIRTGGRGAPRPGTMNLLLVAYFYPPCRDTGAHRPAAMAKW